MTNVRYRFVDAQALDFFGIIEEMRPELLSFPLNIVEIIKLFKNYRLWSYKHYAEQFLISVEQVALNCHSESGCTIHNKVSNSYVIVFNEAHPRGRQQWTLAHELGHCFLNHFEKIKTEQIAENSISTIVDKVLESEADYFASVVLAPFTLYKELNIQSEIDVQNVFGLSAQASVNRYNDYLQWKDKHYKTYFDNDINRLFKPFTSSYTSNK